MAVVVAVVARAVFAGLLLLSPLVCSQDASSIPNAALEDLWSEQQAPAINTLLDESGDGYGPGGLQSQNRVTSIPEKIARCTEYAQSLKAKCLGNDVPLSQSLLIEKGAMQTNKGDSAPLKHQKGPDVLAEDTSHPIFDEMFGRACKNARIKLALAHERKAGYCASSKKFASFGGKAAVNRAAKQGSHRMQRGEARIKKGSEKVNKMTPAWRTKARKILCTVASLKVPVEASAVQALCANSVSAKLLKCTKASLVAKAKCIAGDISHQEKKAAIKKPTVPSPRQKTTPKKVKAALKAKKATAPSARQKISTTGQEAAIKTKAAEVSFKAELKMVERQIYYKGR